ncbi:MAG: hypothetical protein OEW75_10420 [Cyclobacteriaceae bacterium]|nr:hypothetical protein [Cyclobacteriaceae bacterium]
MKKRFIPIVIALFSIGFISSPAYSKEKNKEAIEAKDVDLTEEEAAVLIDRLEEIKSMDVKELPRTEKVALRKEVKAIEKTLRNGNQGIYLSTTAIVIIILVLFIF